MSATWDSAVDEMHAAESDRLRGEVRRLQAEVARQEHLRRERSGATVYERTAWLHDTGKHEGSDFPYAYCPRCEMEHPLGRRAVLVALLREAADLLTTDSPYDPSDLLDRIRAAQ